MNDILPIEKKPRTSKMRNLRIWGATCALILCGLLYAVFTIIPNLVGGTDLSRFKVGEMSELDVLRDPPLQPTQSFTDASGASTTLAAFRGDLVLVNLWATWCAPCITEMPMLADLQKEFANTDLQVLAVSVDRADDRAKAKTRLAQLSDGALEFYHDPRMAIVYPMKARGFPTTVLYDRNGKELARLAGEAKWNSPEAYALIRAALTAK